MNEKISFILEEPKSDRDQTIDRTIKETFKALSLLADDMIEEAKKKTKTREEYIAFLEGAAFIFYKACKRDDRQIASKGSPINTIEDAIWHCYDLIPFMEEGEVMEHLKLASWLNELRVLKGEKPIEIPEEYLSNERIRHSLELFSTRLIHRKNNLTINL